MIDLAQRAGGWAGGRPSGRAVRTEHGRFASVWGGGGLPSCRLRRSSDLTAATESCSLTTTAEVRPCGDVSRISIAPCPCSAAPRPSTALSLVALCLGPLCLSLSAEWSCPGVLQSCRQHAAPVAEILLLPGRPPAGTVALLHDSGPSERAVKFHPPIRTKEPKSKCEMKFNVRR